jgi:hypothetical protein
MRTPVDSKEITQAGVAKLADAQDLKVTVRLLAYARIIE